MADLSLIKKLRESTGCGIADCNKALAAVNDNFDEAVDWLRKKGLSSAAKKADVLLLKAQLLFKFLATKPQSLK